MWHLRIILLFAFNFFLQEQILGAELRILLKGNHFEVIYATESGYETFHSLYEPIDIERFNNIMEPYWEQHQASILYIHSLFGNAPGYSEVAEEVIMKHFQDDQLLIMVDWGTLNPIYSAQRVTARKKGKKLAKILDLFPVEHQLFILAHSMGAELTRHALYHLKQQTIQSCVMMAPDILRSDFELDLDTIVHKVNRATIFTSNDDLLLMASSFINSEEVLGPDDINNERVQFYKPEDLGCSIAKHVNWLVCDGVQEKIKERLWGEPDKVPDH